MTEYTSRLTYQLKRNPLVAVIVVLHLVGIAGFLAPSSPTFARLTPLHLLAVTGALIMGQRDRGKTFWFFVVLAVFCSFFVELAGVQTGIIFGSYYYGTVLGPKVSGTPLIIGINWVLLLLSIGSVVDRLKAGALIKSIAGAAVMAVLDVFIEPVAMAYGFWDWNGGEVPLQNYVAWFFVALVLFLVYFSLPFRKQNSVGLAVLLSQAVFFVALNIALPFHG